MTINLRAVPEQPILRGHTTLGGCNPQGVEIGVTSRYFTRGGRPWFPVMGEFHYSRYPEQYWEEELLKIRAGGINVIATYVFWIHHEEVEGQFDWSGRRDLRRFVELCAKHDLLVYARVGPWDHGECRNGGFPDWLFARCPVVRHNNPTYLGYARRLYAQIAQQLRGLYWKDGGPIFGIQLENEYWDLGPGRGAEHILELKRIAIELGMEVPIYSVTGWGKADYPEGEVIACYGGYPDAFWSEQMTDLALHGQYLFLSDRSDPTIGTNMKEIDWTAPPEGAMRYPYAACEMGGGMPPAYHRRPLIDPDDVIALNFTRLGAGVVVQGYYMYHGGTNPVGRFGTLQETRRHDYGVWLWGLWDAAPLSYDFQAPIGEYGRPTGSYQGLRILHLFLNDFGEELATTTVSLPEMLPADWTDTQTLRWSLRHNGDSGFVFVNNHQRFIQLGEKPEMQMKLCFGDRSQLLPVNPVPVASGQYFIWPVNLDVNGALLRHATLQPLCRLETAGRLYLFTFAIPGIAPEIVLARSSVRELSVPAREVGDSLIIDELSPGEQCMVEIETHDGRRACIVVLTREIALQMHRIQFGGDRLLITSADVLAEPGRLRLRTRDAGPVKFKLFPSNDGQPSFQTIRIPAAYRPASVGFEPTQLADLSWRPPRDTKGRLLIPLDEDFEHAGRWRITLPVDALAGRSDLYLRISYIGDMARLYANGEVIADNLNLGVAWEIGLKRFMPVRELELRILPLAADTPIYLDARVRPQIPAGNAVVELREITACPEIEMAIQMDEPEDDPQ